MEVITPDQVTLWSKHPVTQFLIQSLKDFREANELEIAGLVLNNNPDFIKKKLGTMTQLKGQIHILDMLLDIKQFILDEINNLEEVKNEIPSSGSENFIKGS